MYLIVADVKNGNSSPRVMATAATLPAVIRGIIAVRAELNSAWTLKTGVFLGENPQGVGTKVSLSEWVRGDTRTTAASVEWWGDEPHYS